MPPLNWDSALILESNWPFEWNFKAIPIGRHWDIASGRIDILLLPWLSLAWRRKEEERMSYRQTAHMGRSVSQPAAPPLIPLTRRRLGRWARERERRCNESTYSAVICVTSGRDVNPEPRKESRYWVIFRAASQSSTELSLLRSGAPRSNRGWWDGLGRGRIQGAQTTSVSLSVCVCRWTCVSLLTQGPCCWCRLWETQGCGSSCPTCWRCRGTLAERSCLSANSPASAGASPRGSPSGPAAWSPARWRLSPGTQRETKGFKQETRGLSPGTQRETKGFRQRRQEDSSIYLCSVLTTCSDAHKLNL